uniref:Coproporphyrinogen-III oxidase n=1 Tax=Candidatus Kentrum sp. TUN TaxID=2126343 RepID=A0A450ZPS0_9GAMM|nr:MAG: oxygen-independent coproporphyrinogen-3 oxidase [Candidatus Kentron sp. TUN]VFK51316.1 MAG: oxygen-independent coproporphyrinogen-3 oxidase [Candidatus Kentron sp. TUN]VFK55829.1 MAG: oxygen-independent coproporphyrinogen-3 oxidase [Candidatus Kentron sp. TUN]
MNKQLLDKYNVPGPRYTSYPTVPYWDDETFTMARWRQAVRHTFAGSNRNQGLGLYIHMPYCESLCTYCGCNKRITKNHEVETPYIDTLLKEWELYRSLLDDTPRIRELHMGGGTPTFFSPENLARLIESLLLEVSITEPHEFAFEANPNFTTKDHLDTMFGLGFRRLSFGVEDFDPRVQDVINRIQPFDQVALITNYARDIGYSSLNFDLVYGLPLQEEKSIIDTIDSVKKLQPDRIAFYSYAHVPWIKGVGQRKFSEKDLPSGPKKRALYELGRKMLEEAGYREIGMDHFALPHDALYQATIERQLNRNFMGYTPVHTLLSLGLGVSSISDSWHGFTQNDKTIEGYTDRVANGNLSVFRGHILDQEDLVLRRHILNIMCRFETSWKREEEQHPSLYDGLARMREVEADGLVVIGDDHLHVTEEGRPFLRNICMALDARLWRNEPSTQIFSQAI